MQTYAEASNGLVHASMLKPAFNNGKYHKNNSMIPMIEGPIYHADLRRQEK
jgi:hypothetical protein